MKTPYDFITIALFAAIIVLFLQRSTARSEDPHPLWQYMIAPLGCAVTNYLGNEEMHLAAILVLLATLGYIVAVLNPFARPTS